jgi:hypothetical protein
MRCLTGVFGVSFRSIGGSFLGVFCFDDKVGFIEMDSEMSESRVRTLLCTFGDVFVFFIVGGNIQARELSTTSIKIWKNKEKKNELGRAKEISPSKFFGVLLSTVIFENYKMGKNNSLYKNRVFILSNIFLKYSIEF